MKRTALRRIMVVAISAILAMSLLPAMAWADGESDTIDFDFGSYFINLESGDCVLKGDDGTIALGNVTIGDYSEYVADIGLVLDTDFTLSYADKVGNPIAESDIGAGEYSLVATAKSSRCSGTIYKSIKVLERNNIGSCDIEASATFIGSDSFVSLKVKWPLDSSVVPENCYDVSWLKNGSTGEATSQPAEGGFHTVTVTGKNGWSGSKSRSVNVFSCSVEKTLSAGEPVNVEGFVGNHYYAFTPTRSGTYKFWAQGSSQVVYTTLVNTKQYGTAHAPSTGVDPQPILADLSAGTTYYLLVNTNYTDEVSFGVIDISRPGGTLTVDGGAIVTNAGDDGALFTFTAPADGTYLFRSSSTQNLGAYLYSDKDQKDLIGWNMPTSFGGFTLEKVLTANRTVYLLVTNGSNKDAQFDVSVHDIVSHDAKAATCTEGGWEAYETCNYCDYTTYEEVSAKGHTYGDPTYQWTDDGKSCTATVTCTACAEGVEGHKVSEDGVITSAKTANPTCTKAGTTTYTATFTNKALFDAQTKDVVDIPALNHDLTHHDKVDATCTADGNEAYDTCGRAGCGYTTYVEIPAKGHSYGDPTYQWTDDGKDCTATRICAADSSHKETATATVTSDVKVAATCTGMGTTTYTAAFSESWATAQTKDVVDIPALQHDLTHHDKVDATCTADGNEAYDTCGRAGCGYTTYVEIPAKGHDIVGHDAKDATCTEAGWGAYDTCKNCDFSTYVEVPAKGHSQVAVAATATVKAGAKCSRCGKVLSGCTAKAAQPTTVKSSKATYTAKGLKSGKLKATKTFTLKAVNVRDYAKVTWAKVSGNSKITIKSGKLTVKKGIKKGTYKVKVTIKLATTANYKAASFTRTIKVVVK